jgi:hypothetical protein
VNLGDLSAQLWMLAILYRFGDRPLCRGVYQNVLIGAVLIANCLILGNFEPREILLETSHFLVKLSR